MQNILRDLDMGALSDPTHAPREEQHDASDELDEIVLYVEIDPIMASLYKEYRSAKSTLLNLNSSKDDVTAMREVANDMVDSAWSAVTTRLIELREDSSAAGQLARRLLRLEEERLGNLTPSGTRALDHLEPAHEPAPAHDKDPEFQALMRREKAKEKKRQEQMEQDFLVGFALLYIARCWAEKTKGHNVSLHARFSQAA